MCYATELIEMKRNEMKCERDVEKKHTKLKMKKKTEIRKHKEEISRQSVQANKAK